MEGGTRENPFGFGTSARTEIKDIEFDEGFGNGSRARSHENGSSRSGSNGQEAESSRGGKRVEETHRRPKKTEKN